MMCFSLHALEESEYNGSVEDFTKLMLDVSVEVMVVTVEEDWWSRKVLAIYTDMKKMTLKELMTRKTLTIEDLKQFFKKGFFTFEYRPTII